MGRDTLDSLENLIRRERAHLARFRARVRELESQGTETDGLLAAIKEDKVSKILFEYLFIYLFICSSICLFIYLFVCSFITYLFIYYLFIYLFIFLFTYLLFILFERKLAVRRWILIILFIGAVSQTVILSPSRHRTVHRMKGSLLHELCSMHSNGLSFFLRTINAHDRTLFSWGDVWCHQCLVKTLLVHHHFLTSS